jgi:hypothetical protein
MVFLFRGEFQVRRSCDEDGGGIRAPVQAFTLQQSEIEKNRDPSGVVDVLFAATNRNPQEGHIKSRSSHRIESEEQLNRKAKTRCKKVET